MLAYIIVGNPEWRRAEIRFFACLDSEHAERETHNLSNMITAGRLPISRQNVTCVCCATQEALEQEVSDRSSKADLVIAGLTADTLRSDQAEQSASVFGGANDVLFAHACESIVIERSDDASSLKP